MIYKNGYYRTDINLWPNKFLFGTEIIIRGYKVRKVWKGKWGISAKINLIVMAIIISLSLVIGFVVKKEITWGLKEFATEKAKGDLKLSFTYLNNKYPGEWEVKDNKLYKGNVLLNDNSGIVDEIGKDTGDTVTIFLHDTRIATNVMVDGERAIGTKASEEVVNKVIKQGESFYGEANVAGQMYQTAYMPLKSATGETIGILYVGASNEIISTIFSSFIIKFIVVLVIMALLAFSVVYWFTWSMKKRLNKLTEALELAINGDFTTKVEDNSGDELSLLSVNFNKMTNSFKIMMGEVISTSEQLASSSEQLTASSEQTSAATRVITESIQEVANGAENASASIQNNAFDLKEVTQGIQSIAENAIAVSKVSIEATEKAENGGLLVEQTVEQINVINRTVTASGEVIKMLAYRSQEIEKITNVISGIANQTNLLALNAAIEAARAGEQGKGFAVVANEVRKLAEQSQHSSSQISGLITTIQEDMIKSNQSYEQVSIEVREGLAIIKQTRESFEGILQYTEKLKELIEHMVATSKEISQNTKAVSLTVGSIIEISDQTSIHSQNVAASAEEQLASMEEIASSASALSTLADNLKELIKRFEV